MEEAICQTVAVRFKESNRNGYFKIHLLIPCSYYTSASEGKQQKKEPNNLYCWQRFYVVLIGRGGWIAGKKEIWYSFFIWKNHDHL